VQQSGEFAKHLCDHAKVDLNEMAVFARVVARGSFSAAAREMNVPPSTVSRKVSALEQRLGVQLLERTTRRLRLTEAGALYHERCQEVVELAEGADDAVQALLRSPRGVLRVSAPPSLGQQFLGEPVAEYVKRHADVRVEIELSGRAVDIIAEGFDLAIRLASVIDDSTLLVRRLGWSTRMLCASPRYLCQRGAPRSLDDLIEHTTIGLGSTQRQLTWSFGGEPGAVPLSVTPRVQVNSAWLARELCRAGVGIALLPSFLAAPDLAEGTLEHVLAALPVQPLGLWVAFPRGAQGSAKVRAFLEILYAYFHEHQP
jgi:DNA-binding transcriptional LysR family regulator